MANERLRIDVNNNNVSGGVTNDANLEIRQFRVNPSTNALLVDTSGGSTPTSPSTVDSGQGTVSTAGTAVQVATTTTIQAIVIRANTGNTGNIFVGDATVDSSTGLVLAPGEAVAFDIDDPATVYVDAATNGDGFSYLTTA